MTQRLPFWIESLIRQRLVLVLHVELGLLGFVDVLQEGIRQGPGKLLLSDIIRTASGITLPDPTKLNLASGLHDTQALRLESQLPAKITITDAVLGLWMYTGSLLLTLF